MLLAVDVQYGDNSGATAAGVLFESWGDAEPAEEFVCMIEEVAPYEPGNFYLRELPCLLQLLEEIPRELVTGIIVDGYVWLDAEGTPGLGAHLYDELERTVPIVGVAKNVYGDAESFAHPVLRGDSDRCLWVTAVAMDAADAAERVAAMHGPYRFPTLLRHVDQLCRGAL